jgi:hypothetical protein
MSNYLVWCNHGEVQPAANVELDKNEDVDQMDDMIANVGREYDLGSREQHPPLEVQNFYRFLATSDEKVHDGTNITVLQVVTHLMVMKSKYSFLS